jgi:antitoxin CptB
VEIRADIRHPRRYINPARHVRAFGVRTGIDMTGSTRSSGGLDDRRKRLLFRCWHRGTREMDLIMGRFADAEIATLSDDELAQLEHLIDVPDPDLYAALTGNVALAGEYASHLFERIKSFRVADHDA